MGHEAVVVKNGLRLCGTGAARGSAPILQDKAYWEVGVLELLMECWKQPGKCPSRGLLRDCGERSFNLRLKL